MTVFMDTYGLIAWINTRDAAHQPVKSYLDSYSGKIVTTEWVLLEFADAFSLSRTKPFAIEAIKRIHRLPMFVVVGYDPAIHQAGFDLYEARSDKDGSLTDCISFAVMTSMKIEMALSFDKHFEQSGFIKLPQTD